MMGRMKDRAIDALIVAAVLAAMAGVGLLILTLMSVFVLAFQ